MLARADGEGDDPTLIDPAPALDFSTQIERYNADRAQFNPQPRPRRVASERP
jgi:hypothetical protein